MYKPPITMTHSSIAKRGKNDSSRTAKTQLISTATNYNTWRAPGKLQTSSTRGLCCCCGQPSLDVSGTWSPYYHGPITATLEVS